MRFSLSAGLLALISGASASINVSFKVGDQVKTASGSIKGHASTWKSQVSEYLGIPYATPPVGELRFEAPQAFTSKKDFAASKFVSCRNRFDSRHSNNY